MAQSTALATAQVAHRLLDMSCRWLQQEWLRAWMWRVSEAEPSRMTPGPEPEWLEGGGSTDCDGVAVRKLLYEVLFMSISPVNDLAALCGGC